MLKWNAAAAVVALGVGTTAMGGVSFDPGVTVSAAGAATNVEAVDIDADLDLDLFVASGFWVYFYRNNGNGTFTAQQFSGFTGAVALAFGDVDCDGDLDFVVNDNRTVTPPVVVLYLNNGAGAFTLGPAYTAFAQVRYARLGDLDSDGDLDLVVLSIGGSELGVFLNNGSGVFGARVDYNHTEGAAGLALGDIDLDGDLDVVAGWPDAVGVTTDYSVSKNNGNGTLAAPVLYGAGGATFGLNLGDVDSDGDLDLVLVDGASSSLKIAFNNGVGTFGTPVPNSVLNLRSDPRLADMDGDGDLDVVGAATNSDETVVTLNNGAGSFSGTIYLPGGDTPEEVAVGDLDRDGDIDVVSACRISQTLEIRFQSGNPGGPDDSVNVPPIVISGLTHTFEDSRGGSNDRITDAVSFSSSGSGLYSNQSFITSIREGNEIVVRAEAAPGFRFVVNPPTDPAWGATTGFGLSAYWLEAGLTNLGIPVPLSTQGTHTFENLSGTAPTVAERRDRVTCDGRRVQVSRYFDVTQPCSFTALELRFPVTNAPPDQLKVYTPVEGGQFGTETEGEEMPDLTVMALQPLSSPEIVELPSIVIDTLAHQYFENAQAPGSFVARDLVFFPSGAGVGSAPGFTSTFGPDDELEIRVEASGGRRFRVNPLPQATSQEVQLLLQWIQSFGFIPTDFSPCAIEWIGLTGPAPAALINQGRTTVNGQTIQVQVKFEVTSPFEFDALVVRFPTNGHPGFEIPRTYPAAGLLAPSLFRGSAEGAGMSDGVTLELITPAPPCPADANGDNVVNGADLSVLLSQFGQSVAPGTGGDSNGDGLVNGADLSVLLSNFGSAC